MAEMIGITQRIEVIIKNKVTIPASFSRVIVLPVITFFGTFFLKGFYRYGTGGFVVAVMESMNKFINLGNSYIKKKN